MSERTAKGASSKLRPFFMSLVREALAHDSSGLDFCARLHQGKWATARREPRGK